MADPHLLQRCRAGETAAIEELLSAHRLAVYRLALSVLDDPAEADEATQDALWRAMRALPSYRGDSAFTTWLYAITLNVCRGRLRQRRARERWFGPLQALFQLQPPGPEEIAAQNETAAATWQAVHALREEWREVIVLRYYHDLPIADIARIAGVSERTVHSRLSAAHDRLRVSLAGKVSFR